MQIEILLYISYEHLYGRWSCCEMFYLIELYVLDLEKVILLRDV